MAEMIERALSEEQRMMRDAIRAFVDGEVTPFIRKNWQREWDMNPENRPTRELLEGAHDAEALCVMVKMFASEEIFKVCQHAVELHGGNGIMLDFGIEKLLRDASLFLHRDATVDISRFKIVKAMFPQTAGAYAGPEQ